MLRKLVTVFICVVIVCEIVTGQQGGGSTGQRRNHDGNLPPHLRVAYHSALGSDPVATVTTASPSDNVRWQRFTPRLPADDEIECYIQVQTSYARGGRCIRLAGDEAPYMCVSGERVRFDPDCEYIMSLRGAQAQQQAMQQDQEQSGTES